MVWALGQGALSSACPGLLSWYVGLFGWFLVARCETIATLT